MRTFTKCMSNLGFNRSAFIEAMETHPLDHPKLHTFSQCVLKGIGALKEDGTLDFTECKAKCEKEHSMDCSFIQNVKSLKEIMTTKHSKTLTNSRRRRKDVRGLQGWTKSFWIRCH
ncbi:hypothetical protein PPYR_13090 [Photinus pyralis]|uniref:Uncharacterized protein n=1 Tax=Photinus pyralis TaxID=7054 RepID=A0A1Y1NF94_PHOPY|nr:hypothetical protein PPYR_13090 [Photinus pyralis]